MGNPIVEDLVVSYPKTTWTCADRRGQGCGVLGDYWVLLERLKNFFSSFFSWKDEQVAEPSCWSGSSGTLFLRKSKLPVK